MRRFLSRAVFLIFQCTIGLCILVGWFMLSSAIAQERQQATTLDPDRNSKQNKHPDGATLLPLGGADENGAISYDGGDRTDWYTVQVQQDGELEVTVQNRIDGDLNMEAYGPDQIIKLAESVTPGIGNEQVIFPVKADTWYYIRVYANQSGDDGNYRIYNTFYEKDVIPPQLILARSETRWTTTEASIIVLGTVRDNRKIAAIRINGSDILSSTSLLNVPSGEARTIWHTISDLAVGDNIVEIDAQDASGNRMPPVKLIITRQAPPPTATEPESTTQLSESQLEDPAPIIEITTPENEARFRDTQPIVIRGTVSDNEEVSRFLVNGQDISDDPWSGAQRLARNQVTFEYLFEAAAYGAHEMTMIAEDNRGTQSQRRLMVYRDAPPEIVIDSPQKGERIEDETILILGIVKDDWNISLITVNGVDVSDVVISALPDGGMQQEFTCIVPDLQYGENVLRVEVKDDIGNLSTEHIPVVRQELPPGIHVTTPRHREMIAQDSVLVEGIVSDPDGIAVLTVNGEPVKLNGSGKFSHRVTNLPYGPSTIEVMATDTRGKSSSASVDITRVDQDPPTITIIKPENASMKTKETFVEIRLEISDRDRIAQIQINGKEKGGTSLPGGKKSITDVLEDLKDGENLIEVIARDVSKNVAREVITVHKIPSPVIVVSGATLTGLRTDDETMLVTGSIRTDDEVASVNVNGVTVDVNKEKNNSFSYQAKQLKVGPNPLEIVAIDMLGGQTRKLLTITRVDTVKPEISISILEGEKRTIKEKILVEVTVSDDDQIALVEINGKESDGTDVPMDGPGQEQSFRYTVENLKDGENLIRVMARDISGNVAEKSIQVYKVSPLKILISQPEPEVHTAADTILIAGNIRTEAEVVSVTIAGQQVSVGKEKNNSFSYQVDQLPLGETLVNIRAVDSLGSQDQTTITITRRDPDYQSGRDQSADGAVRLRIDDSISDVAIDYDGDRTDWFQVYLHTKGEWTVTIKNTISGDLDLELYGPDTTMRLGESKVPDTGDETLTVKIDQEGVYYAKVTAHGVGDRGQYEISNQFIEADIVPPVLTITQPEEEEIQVDRESVTITGTVQDNSGIKELDIVPEGMIIAEEVEFNREETFANFTYTIVKGLQPGENVITIRAIDEAGNISESERHVSLFVPPEPTKKSDGIEQYLQKLRPGSVYAVIIGIGDYQSVRDLRFAVNDAQEFYNLLIDPDYGRVPENHIQLLLDQQATKQNIEEAIGTWLREQAGEEDTVFIYYAGHGETEGDVAYWVTHQADIHDLSTTALSNNVLSEMLDQIRAKRMITFLDSCYSAATVGRRGLVIPTEIPFEKFSGEGRVIISASTGTQFSLELPEYGHGVFTYYLLEGLKGKADQNNDGVIDVDEIWNYVKYQVTETAKEAGNSQQPVFDARKITAGISLTFNVPVLLKKLPEENFQPEKPKSIELFK